MSGRIVKRRRGTTGDHVNYAGPEGELTVDTTKKTVVVHDGATLGGIPLAKEGAIPVGAVTGINVSKIMVLFQAQYDAIAVPDVETLYIIIPFRIIMSTGRMNLHFSSVFIFE